MCFSAKPHDPEKKKLQEIIEALNDLFGAEVGDDDKLEFAQGIARRIGRDEEVMAQINKHSENEVMHGLLPQRLVDYVVDAMDVNEMMSMEILESKEKQRGFARVLLKMLIEQR